jgi:acetyl esterase/lipase
VVVIHGGFWRAAYDRSLMDDLCLDLAAAGWSAWNVEYRRTDGGEGGWPETFVDVAAAIDHVACAVDAAAVGGPVVALGHSAGGHLALWAAARSRLPAGAPGAAPAVPVTHAVAQAGVVDLGEAARLGLSRGAVTELLGAPPEADTLRLSQACPLQLLPHGVPELLVHGGADEVVPPLLSERYAARAAELGATADLVVLPGTGHFEHLDPRSEAWAVVRDWLEAETA